MTFPRPAAGDPELRRARIQLATLLAGIEDLQQEWDTTIELADHLRQQRRHRGQAIDTAAVLADLETLTRASAAFPTVAHRLTTINQLQPAIKKAQRTYDDLLRQHLDHAAHHLDRQ